MSNGTASSRSFRKLDAEGLKLDMRGHWRSFFREQYGFDPPDSAIEGPCPKCGGNSRARCYSEPDLQFDETGAYRCSGCFITSKPRREGISTATWYSGKTFPEVLKDIADWLDSRGMLFRGLASPSPGRTPRQPAITENTEFSTEGIRLKPDQDDSRNNSTSNANEKPKRKFERTIDAVAYLSQKMFGERRKHDHFWPYADRDGKILGIVLRWNTPEPPHKQIRQIRKTSDGKWELGGMASPRVLYRLLEVLNSLEVHVFEGEKAADVAVRLGLVATSPSQGAQSPHLTDWSVLDGKLVTVHSDNDEAGRRFVADVLRLLRLQAPKAKTKAIDYRDIWDAIPEKGDFYDVQEHFDTMEAEAFRQMIQAMEDRTNRFDQEGEVFTPVSTSFGGVPAGGLWAMADAAVDWLVEDVLSADQPTIFGAKQKSLKTTLMTDLAVSLGTGWPWLKKFNIPRRRKVLFITGEASQRATMRKIRRAAEARNLSADDIGDWIHVEAMNFPSLPNAEHCKQIAEDVRANKFEAVLLDPLYMGLQGVNTANLTEVGPAMRQFMQACYPAACVIAHHVRKTASYDDAPNLEDLSQAGIAEFAGNYWLMGRMSEYQGNGIHELAIRYGGRDEQFGLLKLDFDERNWTAEMTSLIDFRADKKQRKDNEKVNELMSEIITAIQAAPDGRSERSIAEACKTLPTRLPFKSAIQELKDRNAIVCIPDFMAPRSNKPCTGWRLSTANK
jgi:hypothetical protein